MAHLKPGRAIVAGLLVGTGAALAASWLLRPGGLRLGPSAWGAMAVPAGGVLCILLGFALFARAFTQGAGPTPLVPAHIAFTSKVTPSIEAHALDRTTPTPRRATNAPPLGRSASRPALDDADGKIRELTRKINRAGVMLATGKLSGEGYAKYVEDLKRQRAVLEAATMSRDLHKV